MKLQIARLTQVLLRKSSNEKLEELANQYLKEKDENNGRQMVDYLINKSFSSQVIVRLLIERLDLKAPMWFHDVRLLRHLTGEGIGPEQKSSGSEQDREADLRKWRQWWASK